MIPEKMHPGKMNPHRMRSDKPAWEAPHFAGLPRQDTDAQSFNGMGHKDAESGPGVSV